MLKRLKANPLCLLSDPHSHSFGLVVRDVYRRCADRTVNLLDFRPHSNSLFGVEVGQVYENLGFGLTLEGVDADIIDEKVQQTAKILGLTEYLERFFSALWTCRNPNRRQDR